MDCCLDLNSFHNLKGVGGGIVLFIYAITTPYLLNT